MPDEAPVTITGPSALSEARIRLTLPLSSKYWKQFMHNDPKSTTRLTMGIGVSVEDRAVEA